MGILSKYEPKKVFEYFELLSSVPHGSGNTRAVSDICVRFALEHGLKYYRDELNNVVIYKDASKGYEQSDTVIIQGHLDMVCAKNEDDKRDMSIEPIEIRSDGKYVFANGTSLGGDDCIAVAMALAVLDDDTLEHPAIEAFFTVDEETGMDGARGFDYSHLHGKHLLNIDSEEDGVFTVGCAGGSHVEAIFPVTWEKSSEMPKEYKVSGLPGGHSGCDIAKPGHDNAMLVLAEKLRAERTKRELRLNSIKCGKFDNVIPSEASVTIGGTEVISSKDTDSILDFFAKVPNGLIKMDGIFSDVPYTSLSMGVVDLREDGLHTTHLIRSASNKEKEELKEKVISIIEEHGGTAKVGGEYPPWEYDENSKVRDILAHAYREVSGKEGHIGITHGGLECGLFTDYMKGLDAVSFGPDLYDIHSVNERLSIESTERTYEVLKLVLKRMK